jgi:hypothetical protein
MPVFRQGQPRTNKRKCGNQPTNQSLITDVFKSRPLLCTVHSRHPPPAWQPGGDQLRAQRLTRDIRVPWPEREVANANFINCFEAKTGLGARRIALLSLTLCMVRPCVARGICRVGGERSCINVSGLQLELSMLRAIMDISARAISLPDRLQRAIWVTSVRMRREDRSSISSHPLADLGR